VVSTVVPLWLAVAALCLFVGALLRPNWALLVFLLLAPWGARMAGVPVRATELLGFACLAGRLLRVDRSLDEDGSWRGAVVPAALYGLLAVVSWARLEFGGSDVMGWPGIVDAAQHLREYLIVAGRDPHAAAMVQILFGVGVALAVASAASRDEWFGGRVVWVVVGGALVAAAATVVAVPVRYWLTGDANELVRYFVLTRSRYTFHVPDVNAAASHFLLGGVVVVGALASRARGRVFWGLGLAIVLAALWIAGSRAAMVALAVMGLLLVAGPRLVASGWRWPALSSRVVGVAAVLVLVLLVLAPTAMGSASAMRGSASRSLSVREEFLITSVRMTATAPVLGVGVGTYYQRSSEFMPPGIKKLYGRENAHDYFMQTAAELGVVGVVAFLWLLGASLGPLWHQVGPDGRATRALSVLGALVAFLLTCVTGHPLLVIEVSVPFWALLGVALGGRLSDGR
jgi:hypothetical protein